MCVKPHKCHEANITEAELQKGSLLRHARPPAQCGVAEGSSEGARWPTSSGHSAEGDETWSLERLSRLVRVGRRMVPWWLGSLPEEMAHHPWAQVGSPIGSEKPSDQIRVVLLPEEYDVSCVPQ